MSVRGDGPSRRRLLQVAPLLAPLLAAGWSQRARAVTAPASGSTAAASFVLSLGSCANQALPQPIWAAIRAQQADVHLFGGDNVYASTGAWSVERLRAAYATALGVPDVRALLERPHLVAWDDHDYGLNDGGADFAHKAASKAELLRAFGVPADDPRHQRDGLYSAAVYGPPGRRVQVLVLDTRWFRSAWRRSSVPGSPGRERYEPDDAASKTLLGEAQWRWLESQLAQPAEVRLLYSSIQVLALGHGYERWGLLPHERERLLAALRQAPSRATVLLSGDRHIGGLYRSEAAGAALWELTASGLSHAWADARETDPARVGELLREPHFGTVAVQWPQQRVRLRLHDAHGAVRLEHLLPFNPP